MKFKLNPQKFNEMSQPTFITSPFPILWALPSNLNLAMANNFVDLSHSSDDEHDTADQLLNMWIPMSPCAKPSVSVVLVVVVARASFAVTFTMT